jgi:hypothetical protein
MIMNTRIITFTTVFFVAGLQWNTALGDDLPTNRKLRPIPAWPEVYPPFALVVRGDKTWIGDFDKDGNFLPDPRFPCDFGNNVSSGPGLRYRIAFSGQCSACEHRSGRLILGTMVDNPKGIFVPEIGSKILDFKVSNLLSKDRFIYNYLEAIS